MMNVSNTLQILPTPRRLYIPLQHLLNVTLRPIRNNKTTNHDAVDFDDNMCDPLCFNHTIFIKENRPIYMYISIHKIIITLTTCRLLDALCAGERQYRNRFEL